MDFLADADIDSLFEAIDSADVPIIGGKVSEENLMDHKVESRVESLETKALSSENARVKPTATKKKRMGMRGYSTKLLHRKKAELARLRVEERDLSAWLEQLKTSIMTSTALNSQETSCSPSNNQRQWVAMALEEFRKRQRAEAVNRELKIIQANQAKVQKSILEAIQQHSALEGKNFVFAEPLTPQRLFEVVETHENSMIIAQLRDRALVLFQQTAIIPKQQEALYSSSLETKVDAIYGKRFQSSTSSVVACSMRTASDALWLEYSTPRQFPNKSYRHMSLIDVHSVKKSFDLLLQTQRNSLSINGLMFARRFVQSHQVTMVRAYTVLLPTAGLRLRCNHWTIVSSLGQDCSVRFFVQLHTEQQEGFTVLSKDVQYVEEIALETWSLKMHLYSQKLIDMLMAKAEDQPRSV